MTMLPEYTMGEITKGVGVGVGSGSLGKVRLKDRFILKETNFSSFWSAGISSNRKVIGCPIKLVSGGVTSNLYLPALTMAGIDT